MRPKIIVYFNSTMAHASQIFAGLELLKEAGDIDLDYKMALGELPNNKMRINYMGKTVIFDMADDSIVDSSIYNSCDAYVKRMLLEKDMDSMPKLIPFGLNYSVMVPNKFLRNIWRKNFLLLSYSMKYDFRVSSLMEINDSIHNVNLSNMEGEIQNSGKILFGTRLWDPQNNEIDWKKKERKKINYQRIAIIRTLKELYGDDFHGGIEKSALSQIICPDLIIPKHQSSKSTYLESLKNALIGIANFGLEGSIGWKFAEYISHSMAIVSTPITGICLHGDLREGKNYIQFESIEECMEAIEKLMSNVPFRLAMQRENKLYYQTYLQPKEKMKLILSDIAEKCN